MLKLALLVLTLGNTPANDAEVANYNVNVTDSNIEWKGETIAKFHVGTIDLKNGNLDSALTYTQQALKIREKLPKHYFDKASSYHTFAKINLKMGNCTGICAGKCYDKENSNELKNDPGENSVVVSSV